MRSTLETEINIYKEYVNQNPLLQSIVNNNIKVAEQRISDSLNKKYPQILLIEQEIKKYFEKAQKRGGLGLYDQWIKQNENKINKIYKKDFYNVKNINIKYSILLPVYKVKLSYLKDAIYSVICQTYTNWELCIAMADYESDQNIQFIKEISTWDERIKVKFLSENKGISDNTNDAYSISTGKYICLLDHDDELAIDALLNIESKIFNINPDFIYTDKDSILEDGSLRVNPLFKPSHSPEILYSANYLTHFNVISREVLDRIGLWDRNTDGAQDWDIFWRVVDAASNVVHVNYVCYHWRIHDLSTSTGLDSKPYVTAGQIKTIEKHLYRQKQNPLVVRDAYGGFKIEWQKNDNDVKKNILCLVYGATITENFIATKNLSNIVYPLSLKYTFDIQYIQETKVLDIINNINNGYDSILFISEDVNTYDKDDVSQVLDWTLNFRDIAFCSSIIVDDADKILAAGTVFSDSLECMPIFQGANIYDYGPFGSLLWYRNWRAVNPYFCAVKGMSKYPKISFDYNRSFYENFSFFCLSLYDAGYRGMTNPHSRIVCTDIKVYEKDYSKYSFQFEPYFNEALASVPVPQLKIKHETDIKSEVRTFQTAGSQIDKYTHDAIELCKYYDCSSEDLYNNKVENRSGQFMPLGLRSINWYLPGFASIFYGGIMTVMRLANFLCRRDSIVSRFILDDNIDPTLLIQIRKEFPDLNFSLHSIHEYSSLEHIPYADYSICTLWTTAYSVLKIKNTRIKIYLIQDWEPLFYPAGSTMAQVNLTYKFGFYAIANTISLVNLYSNFVDKKNKIVLLSPAIDKSIFHLNDKLDLSSVYPRKIFYYARPGTPRNCFELAVSAIKIVKAKMGSAVEIVCAGADWDPKFYGLDDSVITNLGMLPYNKTGELYRNVHVGMALMMTKHPSYLPFELMACGALIVSLHNDANDWFLKDNVNCLLSDASATCLADTLENAIVNYESHSDIINAGTEFIQKNHSCWDRSFGEISDFLNRIY